MDCWLRLSASASVCSCRSRLRRLSESAPKNRTEGLAAISFRTFRKDVHVGLSEETRGFFIPCPEPYRTDLPLQCPSLEFRQTRLQLPNGITIADLEKHLGVAELEARILTHSMLAAQEIKRRIESPQYVDKIFNGPQCAVDRVVCSRVSAEMFSNEERSTLSIQFIPSDYFTNLTVRSLYRELRVEGHAVGKATRSEILGNYRYLLTSFGMDIFCILREGDQKYVVFARRSGALPNMHGKSRWHVTMNEGLSNQDVDAGELDLFGCVARGLREENGIEISEITIDPRLYSLFFVRNDFEIGMCGIVELDVTRAEFQRRRTPARDSALENEGYAFVPLDHRSIQEFVTEHRANHDLTDAADFSIRMLVARQLGNWLQ
jgi:hypothetical protein